MRALVLDGTQLSLHTDYPVAEVPEDSTRVQVIQAGICETDLQLIAGYMGFAGVLGHEFVGVAESGPFAGKRVVGEINCICNDCDACRQGRGNHCPNRSVVGILNHDGAFADSLVVPNTNLHEVPDQMPDDLATLVEPVAAALQILEQLTVQPGMRAIVVGDGRLGNLSAQVLKGAGCDVSVVGKHSPKLATFADLNMDTYLLGASDKLARTGDIVVDCTGSSSGLATAIGLTRPRGTLVMKTTVAENHQLSLAAIVIDEITMVGSRCGPFDKAIEWLAAGKLQLDNFVSDHFSLQAYEHAFRRAQEKDAMKVMLQMS